MFLSTDFRIRYTYLNVTCSKWGAYIEITVGSIPTVTSWKAKATNKWTVMLM